MKAEGPKPTMPPQGRAQARAFMLVLLMLISLSPMPQTSAGGGSGTITSFETGMINEDIELLGGASNASLGLSIPRDVTMNGLSLVVDVDDALDTPGQVWLDIDEDGVKEWAFEGQGYGALGHQSVFTHGGSSDHLATTANPSTALVSSDILLPENAAVGAAAVSLSFIPNVSTSFQAIGDFVDMKAGDMDGDGSDEIVVLSTSNATTGNGTAFAVLDYNLTTRQLVMSNWTGTCDDSRNFELGDFNNDSRQDVFTWAELEVDACLHLSNTTALNSSSPHAHLQWNATLNVTMDDRLKKAAVGDFTNDGYADILSIHGQGGTQGIFVLNPFSPVGDQFLTKSTEYIYRNGTFNLANLQDIYVGAMSNQNTDVTALVVHRGSNWWSSHQAWELKWDGRFVEQAQGPDRFSDLRGGMLPVDLDGDGDTDFVSGSGNNEHVVAINNGNTWEVSEHTDYDPFTLTNASFGDHDGDGVPSLFMVASGSSDGNAATLEGNLTHRPSNGSGLDLASPVKLSPWSVPLDIIFADLDGDGHQEQVVAAGETQAGIFVGGWHSIGLDVEGDGTNEISTSGYGGTANTTHHGVLSVSDTVGAIKTALVGHVLALSTSTDAFGVTMAHLNFTLEASADGMLNTTLIDIAYDARLSIENNPSVVGNLSNLVNQKMQLGTGNFRIALPFNSTEAGVLRLTDVVGPYLDGAPNIARPPAPELSLTGLTPSMVELTWQDVNEFGEGLLGFDVYRVPNGTAIDLSTPYGDAGLNMTVDMNVNYGDVYDYAVRSRHVFGLRSNLSDVLTVEVPYPAPPPPVTNLTAADVEGDQGGHLSVWWDDAITTAQSFQIFVRAQPFNSTAGLTPAVNVDAGTSTPVTVNMSSAFSDASSTGTPSAPLIDGTAYHVGVLAIDEHGNTSSLVTTGPVLSRNDSLRATNVSLVLEGDATAAGVRLIPLDAPFKATVEVTANGEALSGASAWLRIDHPASGFSRNITGTTDASGHFIGLEETSLMAWDTQMPQNVGELTFVYGVVGMSNDPSRQPWGSVAQSMLGYGTVQVDVDAPTIMQVTDDAAWSIALTVEETLVEQLGAAPPLSMTYTVLGADGTELGNGSLTPTGGAYLLESPSAEAATVRFSLDNSAHPWVLVPAVHEVTLERNTDNGGPDSGNQSTGGDSTVDPVEVTELLALEVSDCTSRSFPRDVIVEQNTQCTLRNPNAFTVTVSLDASTETLGIMRFDLLQGDGDIAANGEQQVVWKMTTLRDLADEDETVFGASTTYTLTTASNASLSSQGTIALEWTLEERTEDASKNEGSSGSNGLMLGLGAVAIVAGLVVAVVVLRRPEDDEDFTEDDLDDFEYGPVSSRDDAVDLTTTTSLSELQATGATVEDVQPEVKERPSDALISEVSGEELDHAEEEEEGAEQESADDGINVDEYGTEWYEDEVGTWWYREAGQEDWSEYNE